MTKGLAEQYADVLDREELAKRHAPPAIGIWDFLCPLHLDGLVEFLDGNGGCVKKVQAAPEGSEKVFISCGKERGAQPHPATLTSGGHRLSDESRKVAIRKHQGFRIARGA